MLFTILAAVFLTVLAAVAGAGYWVMREPAAAVAGAAPPTASEEAEHDGPALPTWVEGLAWLGERAPLLGGINRRAIVPRLAAAGLRQDWAVEAFYGAKALAMVALPAGLLALSVFFQANGRALAMSCLFGAYLGLTAPDRILRRRMSKRRAQLRHSLPDFLDLLVLEVDSGLPLDHAVENTANDLSRAHPALADEFLVMSRETMAGANRAEALRNLGRRTGEPELRKLTSLLIQAERFGSGVSKVLRTQARYMRIKRRQRAEEEAHKVGVKIIFPVFLLIMPAVFLVTAGPAVILLMGGFARLAGAP